VSFFFARFPKRLITAGPFRIKKKLPQNNPTDALTKRVSQEFRNKIERPRAIRVIALMRTERLPFEAGWVETKFIGYPPKSVDVCGQTKIRSLFAHHGWYHEPDIHDATSFEACINYQRRHEIMAAGSAFRVAP
jgi:hypothetical protein